MFGLWQPTMETLALMLVAVAISVLIGVPLGVAAGLNRRFYAFLRPVLDAMQTVPSTAFLVPAVLFFGIGPVPAAVATVVYAMAPVVRLTALGIRQVPIETVEAGHVFGSTRRQLLFKVQLPAGGAVDPDRRQPDDQHGPRHHRHRRPRRRRRARPGGVGDAAAALAGARPRRRRRHRRRRRDARPGQPLVHRPADGGGVAATSRRITVAGVAAAVDRGRSSSAARRDGRSSRPTGASRGPTG